MANITLRQLRYFEALAHHRHFGRAAQACTISQPALSVQIKELEETLGSSLFERGARQIRLTGLGREVQLHVEKIMRSVDELGDMARAAKDQLFGQLRIGVIPTIAPYLLPTIIGELTHQFPGVDIRVRETMTATLLQELDHGRIDIAIVALPLSERSLKEVKLFDENFVLVRSQVDKNKPVPDPEMLHEMQLLLLEEGHCFRNQALSFCNVKSAMPQETLDGTSLSTLVQMVGSGIGVTLIPEMAIDVETRSASVSIAHFDEPQPSRTVGMVWRKTSPLNQQFMEISDIVRRAAEELRAKSQRVT